MRPSSEEVLALLNQLAPNPAENMPLKHMLCVGNTAARIAEALVAEGYDLNVDEVQALGYIHDIGKFVGTVNSHAVDGFYYLRDHGYDAEYCTVCLVHSFPNGHPDCIIGSALDPEQEQLISELLDGHERTLGEKIITLCDFLCLYRVMTVDQRMVDLISRYGTWAGTQKCVIAVQELKQEFDDLLGYNLYDIFPEIKENL